MKKGFKWLWITAGSLAAIIILILIAAPYFFDIQKYKPLIERKITDAAGRPFTIGGDIRLSLFPLAGISLSDVHLANPDGFTEKDFISVRSLDVKVRFLPLLSKDIQVRRFVIVGPRIVLEKAKDGKASWQGLGKKGSPGAPQEKSDQADSGLSIKGLSVAEFSISEGELLYMDQATGTRKEVKALMIDLKDVSLEKPLKLSVSAIADGKSVSIEGEAGPIGREPGKGAMNLDLVINAMDLLSIKLLGSVTDAAIKPRFDLNLTVDNFSPRTLIKNLEPDFPLNTKDSAALTNLSASMKIRGSAYNIEISDGVIQLDQTRISLSGAAKDFSRPDLAFKMDIDRIDADRYLPPVEKKQASGTRAPETPAKQEKTDYGPLRKLILDCAVNVGELTVRGAQATDIQVTVKARDGIFNIDRLSLKAFEGSISGAAVMNFSGDIPALQGDMEIKRLQLRKAINGLMPDLTLNTKDPEAFKTLSAKIKMKGTTEKIEIPDGTIELDQSRLTLSAAAKDFAKPDLALKIDLDKIDADRYLPPPVEKTVEETETPKKINYEPLRKMILDSVINVGEVTIKGIQIKDMRADVKGRKGIFNLNPLSLNAYDGSMSTVAGLDFNGDVPAAKAKIDARGVQVRRLVSDLMKKDIIEGKMTASMNLSMSGDNAALIKKTLNGKGEASMKDGAIVGIDLPGMINNLKTAFGTAQAAETTERTDFSEFIIPFDIKDGVISTQNTSLISPALRVKAKGDADLTKESLNFRIEPTFVKTLKGQGDTKERSGITVPVLVKGTFTDPKFSPDLSGAAEKAIEKGLQKLIDNKTGDGEKTDGKTDPTKDAVKGLLKGLLGK